MRCPILLMATMATALLLGSAVALLSTTSQTIAATSLYPDLKTQKPFDLRFDTATINGTTHKVLRFSNTVWNAGEGRMELRAKTVRTTSGKKSRVTQSIYDDAGGYTSKNVGDMIFHAGHNPLPLRELRLPTNYGRRPTTTVGWRAVGPTARP